MPDEEIVTAAVGTTAPERPARPLTTPRTECGDGPGGEHEWGASGEMNVLVCSHCGQRADASQTVLLYQRAGFGDKKAVGELRERLAYELGRGDAKFSDRGDCKTDTERQLFDENEYFRTRLQEEMDLVADMKRNVLDADKRVAEMSHHLKSAQASAESMGEARDMWRDAYKALKKSLQELAARAMEEGP